MRTHIVTERGWRPLGAPESLIQTLSTSDEQASSLLQQQPSDEQTDRDLLALQTQVQRACSMKDDHKYLYKV